MSLAPDQLLSFLEPYRNAPRWLVAYSGGVDSHWLLYCLALLKSDNPQLPAIEAIHINHQLQSQAQHWADHCQQQCDALGVALRTHTVSVEKSARESLEEQARMARYRVFENALSKNELLLLGHHLDDQVETFLLRQLRGSGGTGASGMPASRALGEGSLLRPLLSFTRQQIVEAAEAAQLGWVDDPSNQDDSFDRNFLRANVMPLLADRWPSYRQTLGRAAVQNDEARQLNKALAQIDADSLKLSLSNDWLAITALQSLDESRRKNLLRFWLQQRELAVPSSAQLQTLLDEVIHAAVDAEPRLQWANVEARRFGDALYVMPAIAEFSSEQQFIWDGSPLTIPGSGTLLRSINTGVGLKPLSGLSVQFRQGGERCHPAGRSGSQTLKKLMQEYRVPTWLRDRVPLIYSQDQLVAVAGYWICEGFEAVSNEPGWQIDWHPRPYLEDVS